MKNINFLDWGLVPYTKAFEKQKIVFNESIRLKSEQKEPVNTLIFCEHPPVITLGKNAQYSNLLFSEAALKEQKVDLCQVDRGGDVTYHGPGQLVVYPIFDLESFHIGLKEYIFKLEELIIQLLKLYKLEAERMGGATGVWLDTHDPSKTRKICAIGVKCSRYVTMHGFALNVNTDLNYFQLINPCGFTNKGVTSIEKELYTTVNMEVIKKQLLFLFCNYFSVDY